MPYTQTSTALGTIDADEATAPVTAPRDRPEAVVLASSSSVTTGATIALEGRIKDKADGSMSGWAVLHSFAITADGAKVLPLKELRRDGVNIEAYDEIRLNAGTAWTDGTHVFSLLTTQRT